MKKLSSILTLLLLPCLLLAGCNGSKGDSATTSAVTTTATEQPTSPIEYHDRYVDLKSGERLYYRYRDWSYVLMGGSYFATNLEQSIRDDFVAKVKLEEVRLDESKESDQEAGYLALNVAVQEIYQQPQDWTDAMTQSVENGLIYSYVAGLYLDGGNDSNPLVLVSTGSTEMIVEDTEYIVQLDYVDGQYCIRYVQEAHAANWVDGMLMQPWKDAEEVEVMCKLNTAPVMMSGDELSNLAYLNAMNFQAYVRYTLKDDDLYQSIKDKAYFTYDEIQDFLANNRMKSSN